MITIFYTTDQPTCSNTNLLLTSGYFKGTLNIKLPTRLTMAVHAVSIVSV